MIDYQQLIRGTPTAPPPVTPNSGGNPVATSTIPGGGVFGSSPQLTPQLQTQMAKLLGEYTYSFPGGGYIPTNQALDANSYYNKYSGASDPNANKAMADFYATVGAQPTVANTSPALGKLNTATGATPKLGPSLNEILAQLLAGPTGDIVKKAGFGPKYEGPFNIPGF